jgi:hypothetical protein
MSRWCPEYEARVRHRGGSGEAGCGVGGGEGVDGWMACLSTGAVVADPRHHRPCRCVRVGEDPGSFSICSSVMTADFFTCHRW